MHGVLLRNLTIIERRRREVNAAKHALQSFMVACTLCLIVVGASSCDGRERAANRIYDEAELLAVAGDHSGAAERFAEIVERHPGTDAARRAQPKATLYRGLAQAVTSYPSRTVSDRIIATARAVYRYRDQQGQWPDSLERLRPQFIEEPAEDPWGRPFLYKIKSKRGFILACLGADGVRGGSGDDADWYVEDGEFVRRPSLELP